MLNTKTTLISLFSAAMLTACGGGGGDGTAADAGTDGDEGTSVDARTKYLGTWLAQCSFASYVGGSIRYEKERIVVALQGDTNLTLTSTEILYLNSACTQPATPGTGDTTEATMTFVGSTKTLVDGKVVDKVRAAPADQDPGDAPVPVILYTADNKMYAQINDPDKPVQVDSEGFPNEIDTTAYLTKFNN